MAQQVPAPHVRTPEPTDPHFRWFCPKPTVRILFYTDDSDVSLDPQVMTLDNEFGLAILHDLLLASADVADWQIDLRYRHGGISPTRLTPTLLADYEEVWFFGTLAANTPRQPTNELTDAEVAALEKWMQEGGVLMTGDHSNPRPADADPQLDALLGLGRAIGFRVPRAGSLRRWEGGPPQFDDAQGEEAYNTQVPVGDVSIDDLALQEDVWPQRLLLKTYPDASIALQPATPLGRHVHRLFCGRAGPITVFPDHMHEGHLQVPADLPLDVWPSGASGQPLPEVVARGEDHKHGTLHDLVIAYDGSTAGVGRIVADATWHHYFNVNLKGFPAGGHVLNQLAQFYTNLAVWLAPRNKRRDIACWQRWRLVNNPTIGMTFGNSRAALGRVAADVVRRTAGSCVVRDVFTLEAAAAEPTADAVEPPIELMVGGVVQAYLEAFERADSGIEAGTDDDHDALVRRGISGAYDDVLAHLSQASERVRRSRELLDRV